MHRLTRKKALAIVSDYSARPGVFPQGYKLALASEADLVDLLRLAGESFGYNVPSKTEILYFLNQAHGAFFILRDAQDRAAAYILLEVHAGRKTVYVNTVAVAADSRGQGLGQRFFGFADYAAGALGVLSLTKHVREDNVIMQHLSEKYGYQRVREEKEYYDDGTTAYFYQKKFAKT